MRISIRQGRALQRIFAFLISMAALALMLGCRSVPIEPARAVPGVKVVDAEVPSAILGREMPVRIAMPEKIAEGERLPVVYLLHGYAANYTSFSAWSSADAVLVPRGFILVMPSDPSGFFLNQTTPGSRYEDYFLQEVVPFITGRVPQAANDPAHRAVVGMSRGGYGAISIALRHPEAFAFAGGLNSALDISTRPFIWSEFHESLRTNEALGRPGSELRQQYDPFRLLNDVRPAAAPFLYLAWADDDDDSGDDRQFATQLETRGFRHSTASVKGGHSWEATSAMMPSLADALSAQLKPEKP